MKSSLLIIIIFATLLCLGQITGKTTGKTTALTNENNPISKQLSEHQWQQDINKLYTKITQLHPNPWRTISAESFHNKLQGIARTSSSETRQQTIIKLIKAVAMISAAGRDGSTGIRPIQDATDFHLLPLRLYWFADGIYIIETNKMNEALQGLRLTAIAGQPIAEVIAKVQPLVSNENSVWVKSWSPLYALIPELLASLNISRDHSVAVTAIDRTGQSVSRQLQSISSETYEQLFPHALNLAVLPITSTAPLPAPLYLQKVFQQRFWFKQLDENSLYMQYNRIMDEDIDGESFSHFIDRVEIEIKKYQLTSLIVDLRHNSGGDSSYAAFFDMLNAFKAETRALNLYVLTGRVTFSTGMNFVTDLNNKTNAIFIGESTGGSPDHYGDAKTTLLPHSKLTVQIASRFLNKTGTNAKQLTQAPDHLVPLTSAAYFASQDPVLQKALELIELKSFDSEQW